MLNFEHHIPTKVYFGQGALSNLQEALAPYGKKLLLAYGGGSVKKSGLYAQVMGILTREGYEVTELSGIDPNPRIESVEEGVRLCREKQIQVILAVGGGSTIDCAKAVAAGVYYEGDLWTMVEKGGSRGPFLPLAAVLTLSATGSEFDPMAVISNLKTREKKGARFDYPAVSICDPCFTFTVPPLQTASGSADIMSHIMEDYFAREMDCDFSEELAETILRSVMKHCPVALKEPDNYQARANLMLNSSLACSGIPSYGKDFSGWAVHAMEHELSAFYDITHGVGLAILTPRWLRHILAKDPSITPRLVRFAEKVFGLSGDDKNLLARQGIDALEAYFVSTGLPMGLEALGIGREHFEDMAEHVCRSGRLARAYVPLGKEDVIAIFEACIPSPA